MFKLIGSLFKAPDVVRAVIDSGDALIFTDEERKQWLIDSAKALGPQTLARRVLAIIVTVIWAVATVNALVLVNLVVFTEIITLADMAPFNEVYGYICLIFGGVMGFYFGTSLVRASNGKK